ncbi:hypothetical protein AMELA_G00060460 [Ameiurus melas]|uniref:Integrase catalytic domain-containing protein n=1 Tax=Ameiurus melas TaxID=219545 RepID=A0A7J6B4C8_AMEME|nr:hypothetical protein AMELA_G00060460 [Ameiurus melas]
MFLFEGFKWTFNPPAASHHGGVWERLNHLLKKVLYSTLQQQSLDDENFHTILCEIDAILNDVPITKLSDDLNNLEALTPNHILQRRSKHFFYHGFLKKVICTSDLNSEKSNTCLIFLDKISHHPVCSFKMLGVSTLGNSRYCAVQELLVLLQVPRNPEKE